MTATPTHMKTTTITSAQNPTYRELLALALESKASKQSQSTLIFGKKFVEEFTAKRPSDVLAYVARDKTKIEAALPVGAQPIHLSSALFAKLDIFGTENPFIKVRTPVVAPLAGDIVTSCERPRVVLPLQNPENLGAALRSAAAFGVRDVILTRESAHPFHPKTIRAAAGIAPFLLNYQRGGPLSKINFSKVTPSVFLLSTRGENILRLNLPKTFILVVGVEGPGFPREFERQFRNLRIPMSEDVESLNANVAIAIALCEQYARSKT